MRTYERLNSLFTKCHMPTVSFNYKSPHHLINILDRHLGIITSHTFGGAPSTVDERLRRLERHLAARDDRPYFWLGAHAALAS